MSKPSISYKNHHFPPQIFAHAIWMYLVSLSLRLIEEIMPESGIVVSHETIGGGPKIRPGLCKVDPPKETIAKDIWHLDEVVISIAENTGCGERSIRTVMPSVGHRSPKGLLHTHMPLHTN